MKIHLELRAKCKLYALVLTGKSIKPFLVKPVSYASPNWLCPLHCTTAVYSLWSRNRCGIDNLAIKRRIIHFPLLAWRSIYILPAFVVNPLKTEDLGTFSGWNPCLPGHQARLIIMRWLAIWSLKLPPGLAALLSQAQPIWTNPVTRVSDMVWRRINLI